MSFVESERLEAILAALGEQLADADATAHPIVIGGSGLLAIAAVDRPTQDVDVVALIAEGALVSADPLPAALLEAAALVARDFRLEPSWLNAGPAGLLQHGLPQGLRQRLVTREYGPALRVSFASRLDEIHFKLYAAADRREARDFADLARLELTAGELRSAARWARTHNMPGAFDRELAETLAQLGVEDEGRDI